MIKSMTGYGKAEAILRNGKITIEFRSVNGKNADINVKTAILPKDKELGIRKKIAEVLQRGSIDFFMTWEPNAAEAAKQINLDIARSYIAQAGILAKEMGCPNLGMSAEGCSSILNAILRMPDVIDQKKQEIISDENWSVVEAAIDEALAMIDDYRIKEGAALYKDVTARVNNILAIYDEIEGYESERIAAVRDRIEKNLEELKVKVDKERFEQEMIFYIEKLDINEEKVRLRQHCKYFMDTIDNEPYPGKKLGFIIQEMGREINTTGSKANHASIQKCVVRMKDELEKIREQSLNIL
ncbi:MAG: YicC family protein [Bacteroidales bacterium]|nr:YicC family protein [Bacteroidales bacterium]